MAARALAARPKRKGGRLMLLRRVIPCLDVDKGRVVKGTNFVDIRDAGDPVELAARYQDEGADELCFLDITASHEKRETVAALARRCADEIFIPFTIGGGVQLARGCPGGPRRRLRQDLGELGGGPRSLVDRPDGRRLRRPVRGACHRRSQARGRGLRRAGQRRAHARPAARRSSGRARASSAAPGRSCSPAWTATAPRTASSSS